jgi:hypothetical protein
MEAKFTIKAYLGLGFLIPILDRVIMPEVLEIAGKILN